MKDYKGFESALICRDKLYAENTVFEEERAEISKSGMCFCTNPFDVLEYNAVREAFDEKFKTTRKLIESGETHLDNLAEGFTEADRVLQKDAHGRCRRGGEVSGLQTARLLDQ